MASFTIPLGDAGDPRVEFDLERYPRIRVYDPDVGHDRYLYIHRLTAYAHGIVDDVFPGRFPDVIVHHADHDRWNNHPENLTGEKTDDHCNHHMNGKPL